jgi:CRISPR type III-A-associated protein Csm2
MDTFKSEIEPKLKAGTLFAEIDPQLIVKSAEEIGKKLSGSGRDESLKNHQLRRFYDAVKQIERRALPLKPDALLSDDRRADLLFLRPHLANAERKKSNIKPLREALDPCIASDAIQNKADLTRFVKFFEAIVAYTN